MINIGVYLSASFYNNYQNEQQKQFLQQISQFFQKITQQNIVLYLIPFNIDTSKLKNNDCYINNQVNQLFFSENIIKVNHNYFEKDLYSKQINFLMKKMKFNICFHYDACILSINNNTPFMYLSNNDKYNNLIKKYNLDNLFYQIQCENDKEFLHIDVEECVNIFNNMIKNKDSITEQLKKIHYIESKLVHKKLKLFKQFLNDKKENLILVSHQI